MTSKSVEVVFDISEFSYEDIRDEFFYKVDKNTRYLKQPELGKVMQTIAEQFMSEMPQEHLIQWVKAFANAAKEETGGYIITPEFNTLDTEIKITEFANSIGAKIEKL